MSTPPSRLLRPRKTKHIPSTRVLPPTLSPSWTDAPLSNAIQFIPHPPLSEAEFDALSSFEIIDLYSSQRLTPSAPSLVELDSQHTQSSPTLNFLPTTVGTLYNPDGSVKAYHFNPLSHKTQSQSCAALSSTSTALRVDVSSDRLPSFTSLTPPPDVSPTETPSSALPPILLPEPIITTTTPITAATGWQTVDTTGRTRHVSAPSPHLYRSNKTVSTSVTHTVPLTVPPTLTTAVVLSTTVVSHTVNPVTDAALIVDSYVTQPDYDSDDMADSLLPKSFHGRRDESAIEWLQDIELYIQFKRLNPEAKLGLIALKLQAGARTWWDRLPTAVRTDFDQFKAQFLQKFKLDEETKIKASADVWINKQGKTQSVDDYIDAVERAAIKGDFTQEQLCFCLKNGFQKAVRKALTGKDLHTVDDIRRAARAVEALNDDSDEDASNKSLAQEVKRLVLELKGPKTRQIQSRSPSPSATVRFAEHSLSQTRTSKSPDVGRNGPIADPPRRWSNNQPRTNRWSNNQPGNRSHSPAVSHDEQRGKGTWPSRNNYAQNRQAFEHRPQHNSRQQPQQQANSRMPPWRANEVTTNAPKPVFCSQTCGKCGLDAHEAVRQCPAYSTPCHLCGLSGHFARMCRNAAQPRQH